MVLTMIILISAGQRALSQSSKPKIKKNQDIIIYDDEKFHSAFPSIVKKADGEFLLAFRRAPDRKIFGEGHSNHVDPNSYLVMMRSRDGISWDGEPELLYAHAFGGSQDPCLLLMKNGKMLCTSYGWAFVRPDGLPNLKSPNFQNKDGVVFLGGYVLYSDDGGKEWAGPLYPPHISPEINFSAMGIPIPAYNRGALWEGKNGRIYWVVAASDSESPRKTSTHLIISEDEGKNWEYSTPVAVLDTASFNETSIYETPAGDLVAFLRTSRLNGEAWIARSKDGGKSFGKPESMGFVGYPLHALPLPDKNVLLVYGYREKPYGIRARILNPECTDFKTAKEIIIRDDGAGTDLGYPWSVMLDDKRILVSYYHNVVPGRIHIAGSILEIQ
ncbi:MAG: exo-alpha-sialidase [Cyclobacteriaceae bacterium]|nr:exo-alpha-sialidase [Cyclobacteriaceae bacterium]